jgi:hypothetical protein
MGLNRNLGQLTEALTESSGNVLLNPNNVVGGTNVYIGQQMASSDTWKIYGNTIANDRGEMVFELGDNAQPSATNGQRFRFHYDEPAGTSKNVFTLDFNDATFNTNASFTGNVGVGTVSTGFNSAGLPLVIGGGSGNTGLTIFSGASSSGSIHFADAVTTGGASFSGFINYNHSSNSMQFGTNNTEQMRIFSSGNVFIGPSPSDAGRKLDVNGPGRFSGTLSTKKIEVGALHDVTIANNSTFTLIPSSSFNIRTNILVSVAIFWNNNSNAQRQYLLFLGAANTSWGNPNSAITVIASNDWSSGYVGAATFTIGGTLSDRTLNISVANASTYNVTAYASIVDM